MKSIAMSLRLPGAAAVMTAAAVLMLSAEWVAAQDVPKALPVEPGQGPVSTPTPPTPEEPQEEVMPAIPVLPRKEQTESVPKFTEEQVQDRVREAEQALKRKMMLLGTSCAVVGILIGMMIGRKTAPRPVRRY